MNVLKRGIDGWQLKLDQQSTISWERCKIGGAVSYYCSHIGISWLQVRKSAMEVKTYLKYKLLQVISYVSDISLWLVCSFASCCFQQVCDKIPPSMLFSLMQNLSFLFTKVECWNTIWLSAQCSVNKRESMLYCCVLMTAAYRNQSHAEHCKSDHRPAQDAKDRKVCIFDLETEFGVNCTKANDYGYKEGKPCILVKINKVWHWHYVNVKLCY